MENNTVIFIQNQIGYQFQNTALLEQALTRRSYTMENGGQNNEVLEFIGDKVLDFIVVKILSESFGQFEQEEKDPRYWNRTIYKGYFESDLNEGELSTIKARMVNKTTLSACMEGLGLSKFLKMGKGDSANGVMNQPSVKEDLFEAILGAVALDCNWEIEKLQGVVEVMLDPGRYLQTKENDYVSAIQEWVAETCCSIPLFHFTEARYSTSWYFPFDGISQHFALNEDTSYLNFWCEMKIADDLPIFRGFGRNKAEARKAVCKVAYDFLDENGMLFSIQDEIENPNLDEAIGQLEILARRGYFSIPIYDYSEERDKDGNSIWVCKCQITEESKSFLSKSSVKKMAKKQAAYKMLKYVLELE